MKAHIHYFAEAESTMDIARDLARKGCPNFTVVVAQEQKNGRGRLQRSWLSSKGGLYFTIVCKPKIAPQESYKIIFSASLCLAETFRKTLEIRAYVKWPNDILAEGGKICGILSEMEVEGNLLSFVNIGIGINVNNDPDIEDQKAVSAKQILGREISRQQLLSAFLDRFEERLLNAENNTIIAEWKKYCATIGQSVKIVTFREQCQGLALDVDKDGGLILQLKDGSIRKVIYGDCFHQGITKQ